MYTHVFQFETKTQNTFYNDKQRSPPKFNLDCPGLKWAEWLSEI